MSTRLIVIPLQASQTGLTLSAQITDTANNAVGSAITSGFVEQGNGFYLWYYASFTSQFRGSVKFLSSGTIVASLAINPEEAENVDGPVSGVAAAVWGVSVRTLSAFGFAVTVGTNNDKTGYGVNWALITNPSASVNLSSTIVNAYLGSSVVPAGWLSAASFAANALAGQPVASVASPVTVGTNNDKTGYALSPAGLDSIILETVSSQTINARQGLSVILDVSAGVITGDSTSTVTISPPTSLATASGSTRIVATMSGYDRTATAVTHPA